MVFRPLAALLAATFLSAFASSPTVTRLAGANRVLTALTIAHGIASPATNDNVIITSGQPANLIDSVTAAPLAAALNAPILLSASSTQLGSALRAHLVARDLKGSLNCYLVGADSNPTLKQAVQALYQPGHAITIHTISGANRYATAAAIALKTQQHSNGADIGWYVVDGANPALTTALAVAPAAATAHFPILLIPPGATTLPAPETQILTQEYHYAQCRPLPHDPFINSPCAEANPILLPSTVSVWFAGQAASAPIVTHMQWPHTPIFPLPNSPTRPQWTIHRIGIGTTAVDRAIAVDRALYPAVSTILVGNAATTAATNAAQQPPPHVVDAITGAALAAAQHGALIFTDGASVPPAVSQYLGTVHPYHLEILGGPASIPPTTVSALSHAAVLTGP